MPDLIAKSIEKQLGTAQILRGVSFELQQGEILALLGASGSGKTTLLRSVAGLEKPDAGKIEIRGKLVFDGASGFEVPAEERGLGLVFQSYAIWPHRSVFENVAYGLRVRKASEAETRQKVDAVLQRLGLGQLADRYAHQLSGGQQQRVALARAMVYNPPVLLLDEPLSNLDAKLREDARSWLREIIKQTETSALYVTHDQTEALAIADRVLLLDRGLIEEEGAPQKIYGSPATLFSAEFMGSNNRFNGRISAVSNGQATLAGEGWSLRGQLRAPKATGDTATGVIRVERMAIADGAGDNCLQMNLQSVLYLGERWEYVVTLGELRIRMWGQAALTPGQYWISVPQSALWIF
jgi:iron(III) transport system ATP-binding protein